MAKKIFGVYLAKLDAPDSEAHARLELPASPWELHDAMDKVQLQENEELYLEVDDYYDFEYELLDACHAYGARVFAQVTAGPGRNYPGFKTPTSVQVFGAPNLMSPELTVDDIKSKIKDLAATALLVKKAGYDGIELHAMHWGYLLDSFALSYFNHRTDEYGGSLENRMRFIKECIESVRAACGPDFPICVRLAVKSFMAGYATPSMDGSNEVGRTPEEAAEIGKLLESYGVDVISADLGVYDSVSYALPNVYMPHGLTLEYIKPLREAVSIPILVGGCRLDIPEMAEKAIADGLCDGIVMGRALLADPHYVRKLESGLEDSIRPCIGCNNCIMRQTIGGHVRCAVNPSTMYDKIKAITPALKPKKVVVVGGGVSGMEAAIVAAQRGHDVTLYEKSSELGGNLIPAGGHVFKPDIKRLNAWFQREAASLGVKIKLNTEMDAKKIIALKPDAVILSVGSHPVMPKSINGVEKCINAVDAATGKVIPGNRVVVAGGGLTGCEIAADYAMMGKDVSLVEYTDKLMSVGLPTFLSNVIYMNYMLKKYGVKVYTGHKVECVTDNGVIITKVATGEQIVLPADDTVMAIGLAPNASCKNELLGNGFEVYEVGDGVEVGNIATSVYTAYEVARSL